MKKIIITTVLLLGTTLIYAQKSKNIRNCKEQIVSTEDPHNPLVNGIPYNQYKTQVQAEQKQRAAKEAEAKAQQKVSADRLKTMTESAKKRIAQRIEE